MTEQPEQCKYEEYCGQFQLLKCNYEGKCPDKIPAREGYNCARTVIMDRKDVINSNRTALEQSRKILK